MRIGSTGFRTCTLVGALLSLPASVADAAPGEHIRSGNAEIAPSLSVMGNWRSNVYLAEGEAAGGEPAVSGAALQVRPALGLKMDSSEVRFKLNGAYQLTKYFGDLDNLSRYKDVSLDTGVNIFPNAVLGVNVSDRFGITSREVEAVSSEDATIERMNNTARAGLALRPGSSMELRAGGGVDYTRYTAPENLSADDTGGTLNNRLNYATQADFKWRFLPKTAIVATYAQDWFFWENNFINTQGAGTAVESVGDFLGIPDGKRLRVDLGLRGRFTQKVVLGLVAGYSKLEYDEQSVFDDAGNDVTGDSADISAASGFDADVAGIPDGLVYNVEVGYDASEMQRVRLGYRRDFQDVYFSNYVAYHDMYLRYDGQFGRRVGVESGVGYRIEDYDGEVDRTDHVIKTSLGVRYAALDFMDVTLTPAWTRRRSADGNSSIEYDDLSVVGGLVFSY